MEHPVKQISHVVHQLCEGTPAEQREALLANFTRDASFAHPFCAVPSFSGVRVPLLGVEVDSRLAILGIFRWYRALSPRVAVRVESRVLDQASGRLYVTLRQTFAIWFVPLYRADVRLVTVLDLVPHMAGGEGGELVPLPLDDHEKNGADGPRVLYKIARQEDLYQVNEFLKFVAPGVGPLLWGVWQLVSTLFCVVGAVFLAPVVALLGLQKQS